MFRFLAGVATATSLVLFAPSVVVAQRSTTLEVSTTVADVGSSEPTTAHRVRSDGKGAYVSTVVNKVRTVSNVLFVSRAGSDWLLSTYWQAKGTYQPSNRMMFVDTSEVATAGVGFATPAPAFYPVHVSVKCSDVGLDFLQMPLGSVVECPGSLRFWAGGDEWYRFSFQPLNFPEVDRYRVACTAYSQQSGCRAWSVTPGASRVTGTDPNVKSQNRLLLIESGGAILNDQGGTFLLSFHFTVTRL